TEKSSAHLCFCCGDIRNVAIQKCEYCTCNIDGPARELEHESAQMNPALECSAREPALSVEIADHPNQPDWSCVQKEIREPHSSRLESRPQVQIRENEEQDRRPPGEEERPDREIR